MMVIAVFDQLDKILLMYPAVEKVKTLGTKIIFCSGASGSDQNESTIYAASQVLMLAAAIQQWFHNQKKQSRRKGSAVLQEIVDVGNWGISCRMGVYTGVAVAGIVGKVQIVYDVIGDAINCASR
jgi:class 3 adenylate cyclase